MNEPVDVLKAMSFAIKKLTADSSGQEYANELDDARAAVAELIEAISDAYGSPDKEPCAPGTCTSCRIAAALANCQPQTNATGEPR